MNDKAGTTTPSEKGPKSKQGSAKKLVQKVNWKSAVKPESRTADSGRDRDGVKAPEFDIGNQVCVAGVGEGGVS